MKIEELLTIGDANRTATSVWRKLIPRGSELPELAPEVRAFHAAFELLGEVRNGGYHQYFTNSSGERAAVALDALRTLGALEARRTLEEALSLFAGGAAPLDRAARGDALSALGKAAFERLEAPSVALCDLSLPVVEALARHVAAHRTAFAFLDRQACGFKYVRAVLERSVDDIFDRTAPDRAAWLETAQHWVLVALVFDRVQRAVEARGEDALAPAARDFLRAFVFADEVSGGGFEQYFLARSSAHAALVARFLDGIGCPDGAALLRDALAAPADERSQRDAAFQAGVRERVSEALARFLEGHRADLP